MLIKALRILDKPNFSIVYSFIPLESENEEIAPVIKRKKLQCSYCLGIFNEQSLTKHEVNCQKYQKLIENDKKCGVCKKTFVSRQALNGHIGHKHKEELLMLEKKNE